MPMKNAHAPASGLVLRMGIWHAERINFLAHGMRCLHNGEFVLAAGSRGCQHRLAA